jgi:MFS family permease
MKDFEDTLETKSKASLEEITECAVNYRKIQMSLGPLAADPEPSLYQIRKIQQECLPESDANPAITKARRIEALDDPSNAISNVVIAMAIMALFAGGSWGPAATLLTRITPSQHLQRAFGLNFMLVNLGVGFGGLVSASIVNIHRPSSFSTLYLLNAAVFAAGGVIVATLWRYGQAVPRESIEESHRHDGWSIVLRDRRLVHFVLASLILLIAGYGSQEAGFSLFVIDRMQLPVHDIGIIFFFNTSTIVVAQLFALNFIDGRSRTRVMSGVGALWAIFWLIVLGATHLNHTVALVSMCFGMVIFAIGETAWSPVGPALVNEIAPEHLRGRYNAASSLTWSISSTLSPMITGLFLGSSVADFWPLCVALLALVGSLLALSLRRSLSPEEDGRTKVMS